MNRFFFVHEEFSMLADDRQYSAMDFSLAIGRWKTLLTSQGLPNRAVVGIYAAKSFEYCAALLAVMEMGFIAVPLFHGLSDSQVSHVVEDSQMSAVIADAGRTVRLERMTFQHSMLMLNLSAANDLEVIEQKLGPVTSLDTCMLIYTSGSTGTPKGIEVSYQNLVLGAHSVAQVMQFRPSSRVLCVLPFSFDAGLNQLLCALSAGSTVILHNFFHVQVMFKSLDDNAITTLLGVPGIWSSLLDHAKGRQFESIRMIGNTGGALTPTMQKGVRAMFPNAEVIPMYGFSEAFRGLHMRASASARKPRCVGRPIPYASVAVVRPEGTLCGVNEVGQIVQFGPLVSNGYWRNPQATAAKFRPIGDEMRTNLLTAEAALYHIDPSHLDKVAWSGDYGTVDADGDIQFVDRMDDMLKIRGFRVNPGDIESVCSAHLGEVCVVVACNNGADDTTLVLVVKNALTLSDTEALRNHLQADLPSYMLPHRVLSMGHLPISQNGKIDRKPIRDHVTKNMTQGVAL